MNDVDEDVVRAQRVTWMLGGVLLILASLASFGVPLGPQPFAGWAGLVLQAAAFAVFALGLARPGSVTARRPVGTAALCALGLWIVAGPVTRLLLPALPTDAGPDAIEQYVLMLQVVAIATDVVGLVLAVIAVVQIVRAHVVPSPWRWLPVAALVAVVVARMLQLLMLQQLALPLPLPLSVVAVVQSLGRMASPVVLLILGLAAVVLAGLSLRQARAVVQA